MGRHVIVGAGPVGTATAHALVEAGHEVTLVTRSGSGPEGPGLTRVAADASDPFALAEAVGTADALYNCANPPYHRWPELWPPMASSMLEVAARAGAVLVIMGNLYGYGPVDHPMTEDDPLASTGTKGRIRADMWHQALEADRAGRVRVTEARASDFLAPGVVDTSHFGRLVDRLLAGRKVRVLGDPDAPHSWTYVPDVGRTLATLGTDERAWGRPWHVPTGPAVSQRELATRLCTVAGAPAPSVGCLSGGDADGRRGRFPPDAGAQGDPATSSTGRSSSTRRPAPPPSGSGRPRSTRPSPPWPPTPRAGRRCAPPPEPRRRAGCRARGPRRAPPSLGSGPPMEAPRRQRTVPPVRPRSVGVALVAALGLVSAGCGVVATPDSPTLAGSPVASAGPVGYVVCPDALTPIQLRSHVSEAPIVLPVAGTPSLGDYAVAATPDGRWAFVVTQSTTPGRPTANVLIPVDLATQRAGAPIVLPGHGPTRAVVVMHDGRTVLAASGTTVVPVDVASHAVGRPLDLGPGRTVSGMALSPTTDTLYVLVPAGVIPVDTATATAGPPILTGLTVSSVSSPHGLVVSPDGATLFVAGQGPPDFGGRVEAVSTATGLVGPVTSFDSFGISRPVRPGRHAGRVPAVGGRLGQQLDRLGADHRPDPDRSVRPTCPPGELRRPRAPTTPATS